MQRKKEDVEGLLYGLVSRRYEAAVIIGLQEDPACTQAVSI